MKRFLTTVLTVILTIVLAAGAAAGFILYRKYKPSKEQVDQSEWYQASGNESAVFLNSEREEGVKGRYIDGQVYLPVDWVDEAVNERFYWDEENSQLIYTLPDQIVYANEETRGSSGKPLLVQQDGTVWLLSSLVSAYTNVRIETFDTDGVHRIFVDTTWESQQRTSATSGTSQEKSLTSSPLPASTRHARLYSPEDSRMRSFRLRLRRKKRLLSLTQTRVR